MEIKDWLYKFGLNRLDKMNVLSDKVVEWSKKDFNKAFDTAIFIRNEMNDAIRRMPSEKTQIRKLKRGCRRKNKRDRR